MFPKEQEQTKDKIRTILRIAMEHCHDALVLGALGYGAFGNPPAQVAKLFYEVFEEPEFKNQFKIAILEDDAWVLPEQMALVIQIDVNDGLLERDSIKSTNMLL